MTCLCEDLELLAACNEKLSCSPPAECSECAMNHPVHGCVSCIIVETLEYWRERQ